MVDFSHESEDLAALRNAHNDLKVDKETGFLVSNLVFVAIISR